MSGFATRSQVKDWIADEVGTDNNKKLNRIIERMRLMIFEAYTAQDDVPKYEMCFKLQDYATSPCDESKDFYKGFTLPWNMEAVEGVWFSEPGNTIEVFSQWREYAPSTFPLEGFAKGVYKQVGYFATEKEVTETSYVTFKSNSNKDNGKKIHLTYTDQNNVERVEFIQLGDVSSRTAEQVASIQKVVQPADICGKVTVKQLNQEGKILSVYRPQETLPQYVRYKVEGDFSGSVHVRALAKYQPLESDYDLVELSDINIAIYYAQAVKAHSTSKPTGQTIQRAEFYQQKAESNIGRTIARKKGKGIVQQISVPSTARTYSSGKLNRFGRR